MASDIEVKARISTDDLSVGDVYAALRTTRGVSKQSPITPGAREAAAVVNENTAIVRVEGHDGEWSETSQTALVRALESMDGVAAVSVTSGGHESNQSASEGGAEPDSPPATAIDGVGPGRADTLSEAGIETVADVEAAGVEGLVDAGLSQGIAVNLAERTDDV